MIQNVLLDFQFALSASSQTTRDAIARDIAALNSEDGELRKQSQAIKDVDAASWTADHDNTAARLRARKVALLNREIAVRERLDDFWQTVTAEDIPTAIQSACREFETAEATVLAGLLGLGYVEAIYDSEGTRLPCITPGMIWVHPKVKAARIYRDSLEASDLLPTRGENQEAIKRLRNELEAVKRGAIRLLGV